MPEDLIIAELKGSSNSLWTISPPSRANLIDMLGTDEEFPITVSWSVQRCNPLMKKSPFMYLNYVTQKWMNYEVFISWDYRNVKCSNTPAQSAKSSSTVCCVMCIVSVWPLN